MLALFSPLRAVCGLPAQRYRDKAPLPPFLFLTELNQKDKNVSPCSSSSEETLSGTAPSDRSGGRSNRVCILFPLPQHHPTKQNSLVLCQCLGRPRVTSVDNDDHDNPMTRYNLFQFIPKTRRQEDERQQDISLVWFVRNILQCRQHSPFAYMLCSFAALTIRHLPNRY